MVLSTTHNATFPHKSSTPFYQGHGQDGCHEVWHDAVTAITARSCWECIDFQHVYHRVSVCLEKLDSPSSTRYASSLTEACSKAVLFLKLAASSSCRIARAQLWAQVQATPGQLETIKDLVGKLEKITAKTKKILAVQELQGNGSSAALHSPGSAQQLPEEVFWLAKPPKDLLKWNPLSCGAFQALPKKASTF